jgi:hypothetical protein
MIMHWPQITLIVLFALGLGIGVAQHGQPQGPNNFWTTAIATALQLGLLIAGGFFG